jgi:death-on-curing family protein
LQAAACLYYIVKDHVFNDGNKRTAVLTVVTFCALNNVEILLPQDSLDALVILIEETKETNSEEFIYKIAQVMFSDIKTS